MTETELRVAVARLEAKIEAIPDRVSLCVNKAIDDHERRQHGRNGDNRGWGISWSDAAKAIGVIVAAVAASIGASAF